MATSDPTTSKSTESTTGSGENLPAQNSPSGKQEQADALIRKYALFGTAAGLIPSFGLDVIALTAIQVKMIKDLAEIYEYDVDDQLIRMTITTGITSLGGRLLTSVATSITRAFTPLKFLIGGATQAALSGFLTAEIGKIYQARLMSGENPADVTVSEIVNHVVAQVQQGEWNPTKVAGFRGNFGYLLNK
ncbi:uncharacterized protein (DUF697 family) [Lewinella marina]|uniref:DUF697 domain-containing protein n=1 Tax=Neolewinella marina TaxID=438751 RepID=A0A2G0CBS6_9BACT|nr:DUF697 domain-containing protein [Neolewinella marina]NJB86630.1 uncharacterized protein (DUF697 family) [Neolewinella marina]PHK97439.1 hypothetical protein CGL56_15175 [Neolewinella marina]